MGSIPAVPQARSAPSFPRCGPKATSSQLVLRTRMFRRKHTHCTARTHTLHRANTLYTADAHFTPEGIQASALELDYSPKSCQARTGAISRFARAEPRGFARAHTATSFRPEAASFRASWHRNGAISPLSLPRDQLRALVQLSDCSMASLHQTVSAW